MYIFRLWHVFLFAACLLSLCFLPAIRIPVPELCSLSFKCFFMFCWHPYAYCLDIALHLLVTK